MFHVAGTAGRWTNQQWHPRVWAWSGRLGRAGDQNAKDRMIGHRNIADYADLVAVTFVRPKSFPVQSDEHFYSVMRYVERNAPARSW